MESSLIKLLVPKEILEHFEFTGYEERDNVYRIHLTEKNDLSHIPKSILYQGKAVLDGYMNPLELQTYPINGQEVFLYLKRRRWKIKGDNKGHHNNYSFYKQGMKATKSFGAFLKEIGRG